MKNVENLLVNGVAFATRSEAACHFGINPKQVNERMTKRGWTLEQALELELSPGRTYAKKVVIDGAEYPRCDRQLKGGGCCASCHDEPFEVGSLSRCCIVRGPEKASVVS